MNNLLVTLLVIIITSSLSCSTTSFKQNIEVKTPVIGFNKKVDYIVINKMNEYNIPGLSLGVIRNDSIIYTRGYGVRDIGNNDLVTENTIFHTASISKLFTALAIMQLIENNKLSLDSKLVDILPELKYRDKIAENIIIKHLLNHTSGIPDINNYHWANNNEADNSLKEYVLGLNLRLDAGPSSEYQYSNLAYDILGYVIEKISGSTFDEYLKENVLTKSSMDNSDFRYFNIPHTLKTAPHSKNRITGKIYARKTYPYTREHAPSSTLNSSAIDLSNWMIYFLQTINDSSSQTNYQAMLEPTYNPNPHIGLGFQLNTLNSKKTIGHYGGDKGFRCYLFMIPEDNIGLVVLANCDYNENFRQEILHPIAKLMTKK